MTLVKEKTRDTGIKNVEDCVDDQARHWCTVTVKMTGSLADRYLEIGPETLDVSLALPGTEYDLRTFGRILGQNYDVLAWIQVPYLCAITLYEEASLGGNSLILERGAHTSSEILEILSHIGSLEVSKSKDVEQVGEITTEGTPKPERPDSDGEPDDNQDQDTDPSSGKPDESQEGEPSGGEDVVLRLGNVNFGIRTLSVTVGVFACVVVIILVRFLRLCKDCRDEARIWSEDRETERRRVMDNSEALYVTSGGFGNFKTLSESDGEDEVIQIQSPQRAQFPRGFDLDESKSDEKIDARAVV